MAGQEDSIEEVVAARKERLRALRAAHELLNTPEEDHNTTDDKGTSEETNKTNMKFRNYFPHDKLLQKGKLVRPVLPKLDDPIAAQLPCPSVKKEDPFQKLVPKKPHLELHRDVQKRLEKLERRTHKVLCKLKEQERLKQENGDGIN
ncbi:hypothetical protein M0R45_013099 [Rubus argutus]|uniref:Uncharacterized protein n=1 Tax=Rubus argutus TaxID=59490 RepID=A0AAW1XIG9_RUBAR